MPGFPWTVVSRSFPFCNCETWWNETIWVMDSQGELSHRMSICYGPSQIYFYRSSKIILWNGLFQLLLSMLVFSPANIILSWVFVLIPSLVKMTIIIRMSVRCMCCLLFFLLDCGEDLLHFLNLIFGCIFLDCASWFSSILFMILNLFDSFLLRFFFNF